MKNYKDIVVFIADGKPDAHGDTFDLEGLKLPNKAIPVHIEFDETRPVGTAELKKVEDKIIANFTIDDVKSLIPCIAGQVVRKEGEVIKEFSISSIGMCEKNADERIEPINSTIATPSLKDQDEDANKSNCY